MSMAICSDIFQSGDQQWRGGSAKVLGSMLRKEKAENLVLTPFPNWRQRNPTVQVTCQLFHRIIGYFSCMHSQSDHFGRHRASHTGLGGHGQKLDMGPLGWGQEACWILMLIGALLLWWQLPQFSYLQHPLEMTPDVVLCTPPLPRETLQTWMLPTTWHSNALHTPLIQNAWWWLGRSSWGGTGRLSPFWIILPCEI